MFEISEIAVLAEQFNVHLKGKKIASGSLGNSPHKFVWYNRSPEEFADLVRGKSIGTARIKGRWMPVDIDPGYCLVLGEIGGRLLWHQPAAPLPAKYHLLLRFADGGALTLTVQMWGGIELYEKGKELQCKYIQGMAPTPLDPKFTSAYFRQLVETCTAAGKRSVKSLLTQEQTIPGLGNSVAQDIMFLAGLHPKQEISVLDKKQIDSLYDTIHKGVRDIIAQGGRDDETDLFGQPGKYRRILHAKAAGQPCPACGSTIQKIQYLGGSCYFCPDCQPIRS